MTPALTPIYRATISAHAFQRYCERFESVSYGEAYRRILRGWVRDAVRAGAHRILCGPLALVARDGQVVTVMRRENLSAGIVKVFGRQA